MTQATREFCCKTCCKCKNKNVKQSPQQNQIDFDSALESVQHFLQHLIDMLMVTQATFFCMLLKSWPWAKCYKENKKLYKSNFLLLLQLSKKNSTKARISKIIIFLTKGNKMKNISMLQNFKKEACYQHHVFKIQDIEE